MKQLIKNLELMVGNGTSMISLIVQGGEQVSAVVSKLVDERATASNIKSRVNRQSVECALSKTIECLSNYRTIPKNGLVVYAGEVALPGKSPKLMAIDFEPFKPINTKLYMCDKRFHTEALAELMVETKRYGYVIIDGSEVVFGVVSGSAKDVLYRETVSLPGKNRRGGQSANRLRALRKEKYDLWALKAVEKAKILFIGSDEMPTVRSIIVAGKANFKDQFAEHAELDGRLKKIIVRRLDIASSGRNGFNEAITKSEDTLDEVQLNVEKKIVVELFEQVARSSGLFCLGVKDSICCLKSGAIKHLIVWSDLKCERFCYVPRSAAVGVGKDDVKKREITLYTGDKPLKDDDAKEYVLKESGLLLDWILANADEDGVAFGAKVHIVSDRFAQGSQFATGFGGIGGILHYQFDFLAEENAENMSMPSRDDDDDDDDYNHCKDYNDDDFK